ncbi:hypothetical protein T08_50 [Trichinella sp. T8]|nr:hypothetical protein T08_50 [Trichinella sp. T8]
MPERTQYQSLSHQSRFPESSCIFWHGNHQQYVIYLNPRIKFWEQSRQRTCNTAYNTELTKWPYSTTVSDNRGKINCSKERTLLFVSFLRNTRKEEQEEDEELPFGSRHYRRVDKCHHCSYEFTNGSNRWSSDSGRLSPLNHLYMKKLDNIGEHLIQRLHLSMEYAVTAINKIALLCFNVILLSHLCEQNEEFIRLLTKS